ncbi:hypothetical protein AKJ16_DCAP11178 [Drosera capensis]
MESFLTSYGFIGFVNGSVASPHMHLLQASSAPALNPDYFQSQWIDQIVRSWIFATLFRDILVEVLNLKLAREIWDRLHYRFMSVSMARPMQLKRKLTSLRKASLDSMDIRPLRLSLAHPEGVVDSRVVVRVIALLSHSHDVALYRVRLPDLRKGYLETVRRRSPIDQVEHSFSKGCVYPFSIATASPPRTSHSVALPVSVAPGSTWHGRLVPCCI